MRNLLVLGLAAVCACRFDLPKVSPDASSDAPSDAPIDAPPTVSEVRFTSVTSNPTMLRPGLYGVEISAVLRNDLDTPINDVRATLTFREGTTDRAGDFRWRDLDARDGAVTPNPISIPPTSQATFRFRVDALAHAARTGPILVSGAATFQIAGSPRSASPLEPPAILQFATVPPPIVVTLTNDEINGDNQLSFREAVQRANANPGFDRIVFDPAVFPPGNPAIAILNSAIGEISVSNDLVIDGSGAGVVLSANVGWRGSQIYALHLQGGTLVISGLEFRNFGEAYPLEDVSTNNCGSSVFHNGGLLRVDAGTLILDGNRITDPDVAERNCYAASVRLHAGTGHRILDNAWTHPSMDAIHTAAATREISGNTITAGTSAASRDKADECIYVAALGGADLWIVGNICVDQEYTAVTADGTDNGKLYIVNNTFVRNGSGAVRRSGTTRRVELRNNAYVSNQPEAVLTTNNGSDFVISHESESGPTPYCNGCSAATIQMSTIAVDLDLMLANPSGTARADFTPGATSPLIDTGHDLLDRNGSTPGRFNGTRTDRGAIELP